MRKDVNPKQDRKVFKRTAVSTKKINLGVVNYRGGIRL